MRPARSPKPIFCAVLLALATLAPQVAPAQVKDSIRDRVPGLGNPTKPTRKPGTPERSVPRPTKKDPRRAVPIPDTNAPVPGRTKVAPGGLTPSDVVHLPKNDLGVRLLSARIVPGGRPRTEVEVEVTNHGPDPFASEASFRVNVFPENDGTCDWPRETLRDVPKLRARERRVIVVRTAQTNRSCGAPNSRHPDRSGARASVGIEWYGQQYQDRNGSNNTHGARLLDLLPYERPRATREVEIRVSFIQPTYTGRGTVELDWLGVELGSDVDRAEHPQLRVMGQSGRNTKSHLSVKGGESVLVGNRAFLVKDRVRPGQALVLKIRARDRDCAGNRDCGRGNTGEFRALFHVPSFADGEVPGCDEQSWPLHELPGYRFELGKKPNFAVGDPGDTARVCFEAIGS